jgi:hypothetical protein
MMATGREVAKDIAEGLKTSPALLAMVVLNGAMLVVLWYFMRDITQSVQTTRNQLLEMVSRCLGHDGVLDKQDREEPKP